MPVRTELRPEVLAALFDGAAWRADANCLDVNPDIFFPQRGEDSGPARAICGGCAVRVDCLDYALAARERHGIWGGKSERERRRMRRVARTEKVA